VYQAAAACLYQAFHEANISMPERFTIRSFDAFVSRNTPYNLAKLRDQIGSSGLTL